MLSRGASRIRGYRTAKLGHRIRTDERAAQDSIGPGVGRPEPQHVTDLMFRHGQEIRLGRQNTRRICAKIPIGKASVELDRPAPGSKGRLKIDRSQGS